MTERIPIILDTDIGTDIDDAVCLAYLLAQPRCELVGITTVTGEAQRRASLADALCRAAGRGDIPIHSGTDRPLLVAPLQAHASQADVLDGMPHRADFPANTAVEFLRETIRSRPGEITLLAIGPLTNIGLLFALDPEIPRLLKGLVLMGGRFLLDGPTHGYAEWNIRCDPHAAAIVYRAPVAPHVSIGLDVTMRCRMPAAEARQRLQGPVLGLVGRMAEVWFKHAGEITFHDPLAAVTIFTPEVCQYQDGLVEVELQSDRLAGLTHWNTHADPKPHRVAVDVNPDAFFAEYWGVVG